MFKKLGFETATYPPFCTMSWNILFFFDGVPKRDKNKMKTGLNLVFPYSSTLRRSYLFVDMMTPVGSVTELGLNMSSATSNENKELTMIDQSQANHQLIRLSLFRSHHLVINSSCFNTRVKRLRRGFLDKYFYSRNSFRYVITECDHEFKCINNKYINDSKVCLLLKLHTKWPL